MYITNNLGIKNFNQPIQDKWMGHQASPVSFGSNRLERSPKCDEVSFTGHTQEPEVTYHNQHWIDNITFPEPTSLKDVSEFLLKPELEDKIACFDSKKISAIGNSQLANYKIKELLGYGASACAFLMEDGNVLKISNGNHFKREHEDFDIPVYEEGILINKFNFPLHYYVEQYANPENVSEDEVDTIIKRIKDKGYRTHDLYYDFNSKHPVNSRQIGKTTDGKVYLLDPECARKI